jgi:Domain of unknown function (DUF1707)
MGGGEPLSPGGLRGGVPRANRVPGLAMSYSLSMADTEPGDRLVPAADRGALRASHADRDHIVELLRDAAGDGRLSPEELDERLDLALTARTYAELATLVSDLPATGTAVSPVTAASPATAPQPKELIRLHVSSGHAGRDGRWVVPSRMDLKATSGHITLDFTQAQITQPTLHIDAEVRSGHITLVTKPGIVVDADDVSVRSGHIKVREPWGSQVPVLLRINIAGTCGSGHILARPPRRTFWQWLRRAPYSYAIAA